MTRRDAERGEQRELVRKASLYTVGFLTAAAVVAVGGAALIALLLATQGMPFIKTWLVAAVLLLLTPFLVLVVNAFRRRRRGGEGSDGASGDGR